MVSRRLLKGKVAPQPQPAGDKVQHEDAGRVIPHSFFMLVTLAASIAALISTYREGIAASGCMLRFCTSSPMCLSAC